VKWYFALNEAGTEGATGAYARLAVLSARRFTDLQPYLLYSGKPNAVTGFMEQQGVRVIPTVLPYADAIDAAVAAGRYSAGWSGHWLRTEIPFAERTDRFVLYTDCDVVFLGPVLADAVRPALLAAAPERRPDAWESFNSGVMVLNVPQLRAEHPALEAHIRRRLAGADSANWRDQATLNEVFRGRWERLDPGLNWKPYWGPSRYARILHFHGPKPHHLHEMVTGHWDWSTDFGRGAGGLLMANLDFYLGYLRGLLGLLPAATAELAPMFETILAGEPRLRATTPWHLVDRSFT
jgi:hypothetical protein